MGTTTWGDIAAAGKYHLVSAYVHAPVTLCSIEDHWEVNVHFVSLLMKSNFDNEIYPELLGFNEF